MIFRKVKVFGILILILFATGCSGRQCLKVGGSYDGISGNIEYCYDSKASSQVGVPALVDSQGKTSYLLGEQEIEKLVAGDKNNEKIEGKRKKTVKEILIELKRK